jgi:hypothetical protein
MELDDMKQAWQSLDRQMARRYALDLEQYRERKLGSARFRLLPVKIGLVLQIVFGVAIVVASASFWAAHLGSLHLVVSGGLLQAYGVLLVGSAAWEMQMLVDIDYAAPVLAIQRSLAKFRAWRVRLVPVWTVTGCFVWIPLTLVVFKAWLGADIYAHAPEVVLYFVASGAVAMLAFWLVARWVPGAARVLNDSSVGGSLGRSQQVLNDIARFEAES